MSESKFNDGRVLRSDSVTLTKKELRIFYTTIEQSSNTGDDLEKLDAIAGKIEEVLGEYYELVEAEQTKARNQVIAGTPEPLVNVHMNLKIQELDNNMGIELAEDIILQMEEWFWLKERFNNRTDFVGTKEARKIILRIKDALNNAKGIRFVGKQIWVRGEVDGPESPDPPPSSLRVLG